MYKERIKDWIKQYRMIAIIRGVGSLYIEDTVKALYEGGIRVVEITCTCKDSLKSITTIRENLKGKVVCGAGTVMTEQWVDDAACAGAQFISCIHSDPDLIQKISSMDKIVIAGAFTPTNVISSINNGADFVNIFPAVTLGTEYFEQIKFIFRDQFLFATGGINLDNAGNFLKAGASGIGIGNNLIIPKFIKEGNYNALTEHAAKYVEIVRGLT